MDAFNCRISLDEAAAIVRDAIRLDLAVGASSTILHHLGLMKQRVNALLAAFPTNALHAVAIKANPVLNILREIVRLDAGLEAASIEEVELALAAGCKPDHIVFDSPAKTIQDIRQALEWGVHINSDNFSELQRISAAIKRQESASPIGLRINAMVGGGSIAHTSVSESISKFGVPLMTEEQKILTAFAEND